MTEADFAKELIEILDQSMNLIRQELVTVRNDQMQQRMQMIEMASDIKSLNADIKSLKEDRKTKISLITVIISAAIAGLASITVALIQLLKV